MKSIVQEGSTIAKTVESAWQAAGQPQEFTVKILEVPQHNFIGMTTRSAKVALFFKEVAVRKDRSQRSERRADKPVRQKRQPREARPSRKDNDRRKPQREQERPPHKEQPKRQQEFDGVFWTPEMIVMAKEWLQGSLSAMDLPHVTYSTDVNRLYLKIFFDEPIREDVGTERQIFRSFALLLMQHMRNSLKRPLKGFKVVLSRGEG